MKIVRADQIGWHKDHPTGEVEFKYLLTGDPLAPDNFMFILGRQIADFSMPRHRHNFEQIRLPLCGDMNIGDGMVLGEGQVGYFPEGLPYGPQQDPLGAAPPGERVQLVLQFGGASGCGFMSMDQRKKAWSELSKIGKFVGPHYHHPDGRVEWGLNVIWEHVFKSKLKYPKPRYEDVVIIEPNRFHWLPMPGSPGVQHRFMGSFSERAMWIEAVRLDRGATWSSAHPDGRRLLYVLRGSGRVDGTDIAAETAIQIEPGEVATMTASAPLELFLVGLPPIELPVEPSTAYEIEEAPRQAELAPSN
ncbi:MAG TPA: hypothetical protein VGB82_07705 [Alphaproteobacteria bacterium]